MGAAAVVISTALMWMHRPTTGLSRPDFVTVQTSDVRVPIDTPAVAESSRNSFSRPQQSRSAIPPRPSLSSVVLGADVFSPSFAPHGELLFHSGRKHSALMLSPDGMWLSYDSDRDGTRGVYVARSDASEPRKISGDGYAAVPRWSPDGRHPAFLKAEYRRPRAWNVWSRISPPDRRHASAPTMSDRRGEHPGSLTDNVLRTAWKTNWCSLT